MGLAREFLAHCTVLDVRAEIELENENCDGTRSYLALCLTRWGRPLPSFENFLISEINAQIPSVDTLCSYSHKLPCTISDSHYVANNILKVGHLILIIDQWPSWHCLLERGAQESDSITQRPHAFKLSASDSFAQLVEFLVRVRNSNESAVLTGLLAKAVYHDLRAKVYYILHVRNLLPRLTVADKVYCLKNAIIAGHYWMTRTLVEQEYFPVVRNSKELLRTAARSGNLNILKYLTADRKLAVDTEDFSLLINAVEGGNIELIKYLVFERNIVKYGTREDSKGYLRSPLFYAIRSGRLDTIRFLVEELQYDLTAEKDINYYPLLQIAAETGSLPVIRYLIEDKLMNLSSISPICGCTAFQSAALAGNLNLIQYLVEEKDADALIMEDEKGASVLHYAFKGGNWHVIDYLIRQRKVPLDMFHKDNENRSVLHWAVEGGYHHAVGYAIANRYNGKGENLIFARDVRGHTPLMSAVAPLHGTEKDFLSYHRYRIFVDLITLESTLRGQQFIKNPIIIDGVMELAAKSAYLPTLYHLIDKRAYEMDTNSFNRLKEMHSGCQVGDKSNCWNKDMNKYFDIVHVENGTETRIEECQPLNDEYCKRRADKRLELMTVSMNEQRCSAHDWSCSWWKKYVKPWWHLWFR